MDDFIKLGFSSLEEMQLYVDVFGGANLKYSEPQSLEELLESLENELTPSVLKNKSDYIRELNDEEKHPRLLNMSQKSLLKAVSKMPQLERFCAIYAYYQSLSKVEESIYDDRNILFRDLASLNNSDSKTVSEVINNHTIGKVHPYLEQSTQSCNYIIKRVNSSLEYSEQEKFYNFISDYNEHGVNKVHRVSQRDISFVEAISSNARNMQEDIDRRRQSRYEEIVQSDKTDSPKFRH